MEIKETVFSNLDAAKSNEHFKEGGYLYRMTPEELAEDLACEAEDCEQYKAEELLPHVKEWLALNPCV